MTGTSMVAEPFTPASTESPDGDLVIRGLVRTYPGGAGVAGLDLTAAKGELISLLGASGCGKTTTLRCVAGVDSPTSGEVRIGGRTVYSSASRTNVPPERRNVGMVFQSYALWPHLTAAENVAFPLRARRVSRAESRRRALETLDLVGLATAAERSPDRLSGGQQQRVALARALVYEPDLLLFDEPLSNLDPELRESVRQDIKRIQRESGVTALYVTHDRTEALALSDRLVVMAEGQVVQIGTPSEVLANPASPFVASLLGSANVIHGAVDAVHRDGPGSEVVLAVESGGWRGRFAAHSTTVPVVGRGGVICVRPTAVRLARVGEAPADNVMVNVGRIREAYPTGSEYEYLIEYGDGLTVKAVLSRDHGVSRGDRVDFWFDAAMASCFEQPAETRSDGVR